jgi:dolichol-phosphate mannosyltransferase
LPQRTDLSVIIPTYNEYDNILYLIEAVKRKLPDFFFTEIIVVDDNSPDGTGRLIEDYINNNNNNDDTPNPYIKAADLEGSGIFNTDGGKCVVKLIQRENKKDLISAVLQGIKLSTGQYILVMDADFSHPPEYVPYLIEELLHDPNCIVIASRYVRGESIIGWPYKRRAASNVAAKIARYGLKLLHIRDPISGFFAFPRHIIENIHVESSGYKLLLEVLVKAKGAKVKEVPYVFSSRRSGKSKLDNRVVRDYLSAIWYLYRYGRKSRRAVTKKEEKRQSILFLSKAARFYTVGASGLCLNYLVSIILSKGIPNFWFIYASTIAIIMSMTSNFILNKIWTFEDKNLLTRNTVKQYTLFIGLSTIGAIIQLILLYLLVQSGFQYMGSLVLAVSAASISNFLLNKKWTFHEKIVG